MKHIFSFALVVACLTACSKSEEAVAPAPAPVPASADVSATASTPAAPPTAAQPPAPAAAATPVAEPPDLDSGMEKRMGNGEIAQDNLQYLNALVWQLNEGRATYSTDAMPVFKSDAERQAYNDALKKMKEPITDLQELVKARLLKKIPAAPAGKKYVLNPTTHKVELANQ